VKKLIILITVLILTCGFQQSAQAIPIFYLGDLLSGESGFGSTTGDSWFTDDGTSVGFWSFFASTGDTVTIEGHRLDIGLDTVLSLYRGVTAADQSEFSNTSDFGGITFLAFADDEIPNPGPFGDPHLDYGITDTGDYTIAIGGFFSSSPSADYRYRLDIEGNSARPRRGEEDPNAIPEPASMLLLGSGLASMACFRKKRN